MLLRLTRLRKNSEDGFTLVELLVVIIIIGILAAIAIPVFLNQRQRANDSAVQSAVKSYVNAIESHLVQSPNDNTITATKAIAEGARASDGVTVLVEGGTNSYTVCAWHSNGKQYKNSGTMPTATEAAYVFQSPQGTYRATACPTAPTASNVTLPSGSTPNPNPTTNPPAAQIPSAPSGLTAKSQASQYGGNSVTIYGTWNATSGATYYLATFHEYQGPPTNIVWSWSSPQVTDLSVTSQSYVRSTTLNANGVMTLKACNASGCSAATTLNYIVTSS